jgi:hypothetical protein
MICKPQEWGDPGPLWAVAPEWGKKVAIRQRWNVWSFTQNFTSIYWFCTNHNLIVLFCRVNAPKLFCVLSSEEKKSKVKSLSLTITESENVSQQTTRHCQYTFVCVRYHTLCNSYTSICWHLLVISAWNASQYVINFRINSVMCLIFFQDQVTSRYSRPWMWRNVSRDFKYSLSASKLSVSELKCPVLGFVCFISELMCSVFVCFVSEFMCSV